MDPKDTDGLRRSPQRTRIHPNRHRHRRPMIVQQIDGNSSASWPRCAPHWRSMGCPMKMCGHIMRSGSPQIVLTPKIAPTLTATRIHSPTKDQDQKCPPALNVSGRLQRRRCRRCFSRRRSLRIGSLSSKRRRRNNAQVKDHRHRNRIRRHPAARRRPVRTGDPQSAICCSRPHRGHRRTRLSQAPYESDPERIAASGSGRLPRLHLLLPPPAISERSKPLRTERIQ